uniref:Reverse transcriptase domain-containing protein n=1 Tax=Gadus morhua TaxID=8049 RepID=A0A8C5BQ33_GADMO
MVQAKGAAVLILLDLSAWIVSYLTKQTYRVKIKNASSIIFNLIFGVPQGSLLGPLLFILYVMELERLAKKHGISIQIYADDTQLYVSVDMQSSQQTKEDIEACLLEIQQWMVQNGLKINTDKTKIILVKSKRNSEDLSFTVLYDNSDVDSCDVGVPIQIG